MKKIALGNSICKCNVLLIIAFTHFIISLSYNSSATLLLNSPENDTIITLGKLKSAENSIILLENKYELIPLKRLDTLRIASVSIGTDETSEFQKVISNYLNTDFYRLPLCFTKTEIEKLNAKLETYNLIIIGIHDIYSEDSVSGIQLSEYLIDNLPSNKKKIITFFCSQNEVSKINFNNKPENLILANSKQKINQSLAAQVIFGGIGANGKLTEDFNQYWRTGDGLNTQKIRLKYTVPEDVGLNSSVLNSVVDSIVNNALIKKAFPGCNILVAVDGKIILHQAYGFQTFENNISASVNDIYDLASVTKISGGLPGILKLYDLGKIELDKPVSSYYPEWRNRLFKPSDKSSITVRELYSHQSGLVPFIPLWKTTLYEGKPSIKWYSKNASKKNSFFVAPEMYLNKKFEKIIHTEIRKTPIKNRGKYVYSDLPLIITPEIVERISGKQFEDFLNKEFFSPLGANSLTYKPLAKFKASQIMPTEYDDYYRFQQIRGSVHDESAAVMGGVSGNAGLFSNTNDLAKLMQMYLQMGKYGGQNFISESTMKEFTRTQFPENNNRRALIFDKPSLNHKTEDKSVAYPCPEASDSSFGHSGFTGTFVWMDPEYKLLYIFLSNRVYPTRTNNLISSMNVRTEILSAIYKQLKSIE